METLPEYDSGAIGSRMGAAAGAAAGTMAVGCWELPACLLLLQSEEETGQEGGTDWAVGQEG